MASVLTSNSTSSKRKRLYSNHETQTLLQSNNGEGSGTTRTVNITGSDFPSLKTQCAFTYHTDFHIVARMTLVERFKHPGNTSRLLTNSSKTKKYNPGGRDLPQPPGCPYPRCRMSFQWCPPPAGVSFSFVVNFQPPHPIPLLTSWQTHHFHCQEKGKKDACTFYPETYS